MLKVSLKNTGRKEEDNAYLKQNTKKLILYHGEYKDKRR